MLDERLDLVDEEVGAVRLKKRIVDDVGAFTHEIRLVAPTTPWRASIAAH
jgi:hypothetical protein